jgi:hypothetical protein
MKTLYLDETGNYLTIDPTYPIYVLGGVVVDSAHFQSNYDLLNAFKIKYFGSTSIVLHSSDIVRQNGVFGFLRDKKDWHKFVNDMNALIERMNFSVIACIIDTKNYNCEEILADSIQCVSECFSGGQIIMESAGKIRDAEFMAAFGESNYQSEKISRLYMQAKSENVMGLQLADLILSPIARNYLGLKTGKDYEVITEKECEIIILKN